MTKLSINNLKGEKVSDITLNSEVFGIEVNELAMKKMVRLQLNASRQGTAKVKTRSEVSGGGRKPWKQKGTGRARQGSTKAPQWRGGGIAFAPKPRDFSKKVNKEAKRVAFRSAISTKLANKELIVLENLDIKDAKTKTMVEVLNKIGADRTAVIVTKGQNENVLRASANLQNVEVTNSDLLNVYDIIKCDKLVLTADAIKSIEEGYKA